jgi:hypothetical protein
VIQESEKFLEKEKHKLSISARIAFSVLAIFIALGVAFYLAIYLAVPRSFVIVGFLTTLLLGLSFPHLSYKKDNWAIIPFGITVAWILLLTVIMLPLAKNNRLTLARNEIPIYPGAELVSTTYTSGVPTGQPMVKLIYRTANPEEEFPKIKEYFAQNIDKQKWMAATEQSSEPLDSAYYTKRQNHLPYLAIDFEENSVDPIVVRASF